MVTNMGANILGAPTARLSLAGGKSPVFFARGLCKTYGSPSRPSCSTSSSGRLVEAQREQVAALKALGYPSLPIAAQLRSIVHSAPYRYEP